MKSKPKAYQLAALEKARQIRLEKSEEADDELYDLINLMPDSSVYKLAKTIGWSTGKTHGAIRRLEKDGLIKAELVVADGRTKLMVKPTPWHEFFTEVELEEMRQPGYFDEIESILKKSSQ
jgi:DNA-binding PadR family transcriptional regulator